MYTHTEEWSVLVHCQLHAKCVHNNQIWGREYWNVSKSLSYANNLVPRLRSWLFSGIKKYIGLEIAEANIIICQLESNHEASHFSVKIIFMPRNCLPSNVVNSQSLQTFKSRIFSCLFKPLTSSLIIVIFIPCQCIASLCVGKYPYISSVQPNKKNTLHAHAETIIGSSTRQNPWISVRRPILGDLSHPHTITNYHKNCIKNTFLDSALIFFLRWCPLKAYCLTEWLTQPIREVKVCKPLAL